MKSDCEDKTVVAVSGYFDPFHVGHLEYFKKAKELGDELVVIVNSDEAAKKKKGYSFMPFEERLEIIRAIEHVDKVVEDIDKDGTVKKTLAKIRSHIFAQGGDRNEGNIPETPVCEKHKIEIVDGLGEKKQSSSELVERHRRINDGE